MSVTAASAGAKACIRFGVTAVGDISRQCHVTRPVFKAGPLRVVSFGEVMAMAQRRSLLESRLALAADRADESSSLRVGVSPHSPYSIEIPGYARCLEVAREKGLPLATHLAETRSEWEFLAGHAGKLRELWDAWLTWDDVVPKFAGGPIRMAEAVGLLDYPTVLAHVNYCDDDELALLAKGRASVVYCPRTHEYFGHTPHRFREMMQRGINVAIGTDSCASSPDLNIVDDLRLVHRRYPEVPVEALWGMATVNAGKALGLAGWRERADLVSFPVRGDEPLREILENQVLPSGVWIGGTSAQ
jgi:cytosine/adenosine deaminase-related metal-dependent hydrolase